jgi:Transposase DDE domain
MPHCTRRRRARQIEALRAQFAQADGLAFADVLAAERVETALREEGATWREKVYTPLLTLWAFLSQVASPDGSCRAAVCRVLAWLVSQGRPACTPKTDPYCKARRRLPEPLLRRLARETGQALHEGAPAEWLWKGRKVKVVDGSTVSMPDTKANQQAYPQHNAQKAGLGFPIARTVVVFCLACGAVLDAALGRYQGKRTGENALLRELADALGEGDVVLGDRYFGGWFDLALWRARGIDAVVRLHQGRKADFRTGRRLGRKDHVVVWAKPKRPAWMDAATYAALPEALEVREVEVRVRQRGFRSRKLVVVTTLLDAVAYPARDLAALYRARWHAELDLRSLKVVLGLDVLRCKTPEMVRKEFWAHLLAYNLIRTVMARSAQDLGVTPRELSFTAALQAVRAFAERLLDADSDTAEELYDWLPLLVACHLVGGRPDRVEPRARKRRPKHYTFLSKPREQARAALLKGVRA